MTNSNISFIVNVVSQFLISLYNSCWYAVVRILRYINESLVRSLVYVYRGNLISFDEKVESEMLPSL
ncbi:hypothetical protein CR513_63102, partial [Mucuna pruriens]